MDEIDHSLDTDVLDNIMRPFASIVYLTKDGGNLFAKSLEAVFTQKTDFEFEVIVVDSGSTDGTLELFEKFPVKVYRITANEFDFGLTRDYGFSLAKGEIILTLSQDVVPASNDWLQLMVDPFIDAKIAVVQGTDIVPNDVGLFFWYANGLFYYTRDLIKWKHDNEGIGISFTSCALRRSVWSENHIGKAAMNEDKIFQQKIKSKGFKIVQQLLAKTYHAHMYTVKELAKRCENEGMGWRLCSLNYSMTDMMKDMFNKKITGVLISGIFSGEVKRLAEILFPVIRPYYLYKGNHYTSAYIK